MVYTFEGFTDPIEPEARPTITLPSLSATPSLYRVNSAVPDSLQCYITAADEEVAMRRGPTTRSMTRTPSPPILTSTPMEVEDRPTSPLPDLSRNSSLDSFDAVDSDIDGEIAHMAALSIYEQALSTQT